MAAKVFHDLTADHKWSTAGNWNDGLGTIPGATDDVTVDTDITSLIIDTDASCLSFAATGTAGITISGSNYLICYGNFTLDANVTWTNTGILYMRQNACSVNTAGVSLSTITRFNIYMGADVTLLANLNLGTKPLYIYQNGSSLDTGNFQIDCGTFTDNSQTGTVTLTLGSSIINCTNVSFASATLTVSDNTATINVTTTDNITSHLGGVAWGTDGDTSFVYVMTGGKALTLQGTNTVGNFTISWTTENILNFFNISANQVVSGTFRVDGATTVVRPTVRSNTGTTARTITAGTVDINNAVDFANITGAGAGSWDLSGIASGNCGGNSGITFRTPATYYAVGAVANINMTSNCWTTTDGGESRAAEGTGVFPLPQDTIIIDNYTWDDTGNSFTVSTYHHIGNFDVSGLSEANSIIFGISAIFGDITITNANTTFSGAYSITLCPILKNEATDTQDININNAMSASDLYIGPSTSTFTFKQGGTVKLLSDITLTSGNVTLTGGTLELNGNTITCNVFSSSNTNTRTLQDTAGGGGIVVKGLTGTIFDFSTTTSLTVSNSPDITIGNSASPLTYTAAVTAIFGQNKYFGDLLICDHAGDYAVNIQETA